MTPEQKQRIEQIRERMGRYKLEPYAPDLWWDDTNFLLSLVKSQEAEHLQFQQRILELETEIDTKRGYL